MLRGGGPLGWEEEGGPGAWVDLDWLDWQVLAAVR